MEYGKHFTHCGIIWQKQSRWIMLCQRYLFHVCVCYTFCYFNEVFFPSLFYDVRTNCFKKSFDCELKKKDPFLLHFRKEKQFLSTFRNSISMEIPLMLWSSIATMFNKISMESIDWSKWGKSYNNEKYVNITTIKIKSLFNCRL